MNQNKQSGFVKWLLITISVLFLFVMLVLPLLVVITQAFKSGVAAYLKAVTDKYTVRALLLTLEATLTAVVVNTIFGLFAAWTITKFKFKGKKLLTTLIDIPVTVSPVIAGLIFILLFGRQSLLYPILKACHIKVVFAVPGIILATVFVTFPFISRELIPVLETEGTDEEEAAALMGAGAFTIFRKITLSAYPLGTAIRHCLMYGACNGRVRCGIRFIGTFKGTDQHPAASCGNFIQ